jgi:tripartite-type tricarboxylate transporter receptor subunit TctC
MVPYTGAVLAPRMVPKAVRDRLISAFSQGVQSPEYRKLISANGMTLPDSPLVGEALDKHYAHVYQLFGEYIEPLGLGKK